MNKNLTELVFILDRSGSMAGLEGDTIGGFNAMLAKQRALDGPCRLTTVLFNSCSTLLHDRIDIQAVSPMTGEMYCPGGSTALLDAIGQTICKLVQVQRSTAESHRAGRVLFVIITDGAENASRTYTLREIRDMISRQQEKYGWEFLFLGANMDAVETAGHFGISPDRAADYVPDAAGTALNFQAVSEAAAVFRASAAMPQAPLSAVRLDCETRGPRP